MKRKIVQSPVVTFALVLICLITVILPRSVFGGGSESPSVTGKNQLVQALNAAYTRVLSSGKWEELTTPYGAGVVNLADCYPTPEYASFPANPTGLLKTILDTRQIKVGTYSATLEGSANYFLPLNNALLDAILGELAKAYYLPGPITRITVEVTPPSGDNLFKQLNSGVFDITDLNSAIGGASRGWPYQANKQIRRYIARFTCTAMASGQYLQVKDGSTYQSMADVQADPNATLCAGMLSSQLANAYFPGHTITLPSGNDIEQCGQGVLDGTYAAYVHFDSTPVKPGLRTINTGIVSGVPIWVAGDSDQDQDGIPDDLDNCPTVSNSDQADADGDGIGDVCDNCPTIPNGPKGGTCTKGKEGIIGSLCVSDCECGTDGFCSMNQEDTNRDGSGDACGPIAHIDIQPETLNTESKDQDAVVTVKVFPPSGYTADAIIPESVMIADIGGNTTNIAPIKWKIENGNSVLVLKYNRSEILNVLRSYQLTGSVDITLTGRLTDNKLFIGSDRVTVKGKGKE